jgi:hypothetical protein
LVRLYPHPIGAGAIGSPAPISGCKDHRACPGFSRMCRWVAALAGHGRPLPCARQRRGRHSTESRQRRAFVFVFCRYNRTRTGRTATAPVCRPWGPPRPASSAEEPRPTLHQSHTLARKSLQPWCTRRGRVGLLRRGGPGRAAPFL